MVKRILFVITLTTLLCFALFNLNKVWQFEIINASEVSKIKIENYNNLNEEFLKNNHKTITLNNRDDIEELVEALNDLEDASQEIKHCELDIGERYLISVMFKDDKKTITIDVNMSCYDAVIDGNNAKLTNETLIKILYYYSDK